MKLFHYKRRKAEYAYTTIERHSEELILAVMKGDILLLKTLLEQPVDVNSTTKMGLTPLMIAAYYTWKDKQVGLGMIEMLLENGADANMLDNRGNSVGDWATFGISDMGDEAMNEARENIESLLCGRRRVSDYSFSPSNDETPSSKEGTL